MIYWVFKALRAREPAVSTAEQPCTSVVYILVGRENNNIYVSEKNKENKLRKNQIVIFYVTRAHFPKVTFEQKIECEGGRESHAYQRGVSRRQEQIVQRA